MQFRSPEAWNFLMKHRFVFTLRPVASAKRTLSKVDAWRETDIEGRREAGEVTFPARKVKLPLAIFIYGDKTNVQPELLPYVKWSGFRSLGDWLRAAVQLSSSPRPGSVPPNEFALYYVHLL